MRRTRSAMAAGAIVAALLAAAGCTNSSSSTSANNAPPPAGAAATTRSHPAQVIRPMTAVRLAAASAEKAGSAHVAGEMTMTLGPAFGSVTGYGNQPVTVHFTADKQWSPQVRARMQMTGLPGLPGGGMTMLLVGSRMYVHVPGLARQLGKPWLTLDLAALGRRAGLNLGRLLDRTRQLDPAAAVRMLQASGDLHRVGTATVGGTRTTHYAGTVAVGPQLRRLAGPIGARARAALRMLGVRTEHVEVWLDGSQRVLREKTSAHGARFRMSTDMRLSHYGESVAVTPPAASRTVDLSSLLGTRRAIPRT